MNMTTTITLAGALVLSGCATVRPQARVIDATNKAPIFSRTVEKEKSKTKETDKKTTEKTRTSNWNFTY